MLNTSYLRYSVQGAISRPGWELKRGSDHIPLHSLISPLRYDILVRLDYIRFFLENSELYEHSFPEYVKLARKHAYYVWFKEIVCGTIHRRLLRNESRLSRAFEKRLNKTARLFERFRKVGFDVRHPIILNAGKTILTTSTAKKVQAEYYAGDGCHRIALLLLAGQWSLPPETYCVRYFDEYSPRDNTHLLLRHLELSEKEYCTFLSMGYAQTVLCDVESLLDHVSRVAPTRLLELETVMAVDGATKVKESHGPAIGKAESCVAGDLQR